MQKINIKYILQSVLVFIIIYIYFKNSIYINKYVKEALYLCYSTVIPSLFIFMVLTIFLSGQSVCKFIGIPFSPIFRLLKIKNTELISYCVLSILSGFATGGYFLNKIKEENICDNNGLGIISILVSNNSHAFVISAVGINMLGHIQSGVILYFSILFSSFITAFLCSFIYPYSTINNSKNIKASNTNFTSSLNSAVFSIITICGVVILSYTICKVVSLYTENLFISSLFSAIFEVTTACKMIIENTGKNIYLICFALSLCPLSTYLQLKSFNKSNNTNLKILLLSKFIHIPLSLLILRIAVNIFPQSFSVYANSDINVKMHWNSPQISCCFLILSVCFVILFDKEIGVFTKYDK